MDTLGVKMMESIKNTFKMFESWDLETLNNMRWLVIFVIVADLIGLYWYFHWKTFAIALLIVSIGILAGVMILELRKKAEKEVIEIMAKPKKEKKTKKKAKQEKKKKNLNEYNFGFGDPEEYRKKLEIALS